MAAVAFALQVWTHSPDKAERPDRAAETRPGRDTLVRAVGSIRLVEPRLTGGFAYAAWAPDRGASRVPPPAAIRLAAAQLEQVAATDDDRAIGASVAIAQLAQGDVDKAIDGLRHIADGAPPDAAPPDAAPPDAAPLDAAPPDAAPLDATVLSDLAAAHLARVPSQARATDAVAALDAAAWAVRIAPGLPEARFNLALALEAVHLHELAVDAWRAYEGLDPSSPWSAESRAHRARLDARIAERWETQRARLGESPIAAASSLPGLDDLLRANPQLVREHVDDLLLPRWAEQVLAGEASAEALQQQGEALAIAVRQAQGDPLTADAMAAIRARPPCVPILARGHLRFASGRALYLAGRYHDAEAPLREAEAAFRRCASPFALWSAQHRAVVDYFLGRVDASLRTLDAVEAEATRRGYVNVIGRAKWMRAIIFTARSQAVPALREYRAADALFRRAHESEGLVGVSAGIAEDLRDLGEIEESWWPRLSALDGTLHVRPARRHAAYWLAATGAEEQGHYHAADWFLEQTLRTAIASERPSLVAEAHMRRMSVRHKLGQQALAEADLAAARSWTARIGDPLLKSRTAAEIAALEASLWRTVDPARASRAIARAFAFFTAPDWTRRRPGLYLTSGRVHAAQRQWPPAAQDFKAGIASFEATRQSIPAGALQDAFADEGADLFDELVWTHWAGTGRRDLALTFAERGRAAVLARGLKISDVSDPARLTQALPAGVAVVYFSVLSDRVAIWLLQRTGLQSFERRLPRQTLEASVDRFVSLLERDDPDEAETMRQASARLYDTLLAPLGNLAPDTTLVFVPHGVLHRVPFGALFDARRQRYVIEEHTIGVAPSLAVLAHTSRHFRRLAATAPRNVLAIGNPAVAADEGRALPALPESAREARDVASMYASNRLLEARAATRSAFLTAAPDYDIVHVAAHAIANPRRPELSRLLLAPDPGREFGAVYPSDVVGLTFARTRVIVLAACRTAGGRTSASEGLLGMARPFLARGVPTVLAALWDLDDRTSRTLFASFHRALRSGREPGDALRQAQLALLHGSDPAARLPSRWGALTLIGAPGGWSLAGASLAGSAR